MPHTSFSTDNGVSPPCVFMYLAKLPFAFHSLGSCVVRVCIMTVFRLAAKYSPNA